MSYKGYVMSEEQKRKISETRKRKKIKVWNKGIPRTEEEKKIMSENRKGKCLGNRNQWKGGALGWCHQEARRLFGKGECEICGITEEEYIQKFGMILDMHCDGHRYKNMERIFWTQCCRLCHKKMEKLN